MLRNVRLIFQNVFLIVYLAFGFTVGSAVASELKRLIYLDPSCSQELTPTEAIQRAFPEVRHRQSLYSGCLYKVFTVLNFDAAVSEPTLIWPDTFVPIRAWLLRKGELIVADVKVMAGASTVSFDSLLPGDTLIVKYKGFNVSIAYFAKSEGMRLTDREEASVVRNNIRMWHGFCYAVILMNIITFLSLINSNKVYKFYILYAGSMLLFVESVNGLIPALLGLHNYANYFPWWQIVVQVTGALAQAFVVIYLQCYISFKARRKAIPYIFKGLYFLIGLQIVLSFFAINFAHDLSNITILMGAAFLVSMSYYFSFVEKKMSKLIFFGFMIPTITTSLFVLAVVGAINLGIYGYIIILVGNSLEAVSFAIGTMMSFNSSFASSLKTKTHLLSQLRKIVYPHQVKMMTDGSELEATMPTYSAEACVISFDIIGSSKIQHEKAKDFFRGVFLRCNELMMEGYDGESLRAEAYRIKEMGDGFLCSVGYPFKSKTGYMAKDAIELSMRFYQIFCEEVARLGYMEPIHCGFGIALDHITGFYPESGTKEYDLYGRAIILATRYEGMRKALFKGPPGSYLIIQERVYMSLRREETHGFNPVDLDAAGIVVRDDPSAKKLYYKVLSESSVLRTQDKEAA